MADIPKIPAAQVAIEGVVVVGKVGDEDVQQPIVVVVGEIDAHAALGDAVVGISGSGKQADLGKGPVPLVLEHEVGHLIVGHVEVQVPVVVVVGPHHPESVGGLHTPHSGLLGHILEDALAVVAVEDSPSQGRPKGPHCTMMPRYWQFMGGGSLWSKATVLVT